jgi:hypothetical protein
MEKEQWLGSSSSLFKAHLYSWLWRNLGWAFDVHFLYFRFLFIIISGAED